VVSGFVDFWSFVCVCVCVCHGYAVSFFFSAFERCPWSCWITWYGFGEKGRGSNLMKSKLTWYCVTYVYGDDSYYVLKQSSYCSIVIEIKKKCRSKNEENKIGNRMEI